MDVHRNLYKTVKGLADRKKKFPGAFYRKK